MAQLALLRLYCATELDRDNGQWLALAFWAAQGGGMLLNALAVPILSLSTIVALYVMDRRVDWLRRLRPLHRRAADGWPSPRRGSSFARTSTACRSAGSRGASSSARSAARRT